MASYVLPWANCCHIWSSFPIYYMLIQNDLKKDILFSHRHARCNPFKALKVLLVSEDRADLWTSLLTMCGATKVQQHKISNNNSGRFCLVPLDIPPDFFSYQILHFSYNAALSYTNCVLLTYSLSGVWCSLVCLKVTVVSFVLVFVDISAEGLDLVVSVSPCPAEVLKCVMATNTPVVSLEWLVHCVICGERLAYDSQPEYHHDYSS